MNKVNSFFLSDKAQKRYREYVADLIWNSAQTLDQLETIAKDNQVYFHFSCYTNMRDALFHYRKLYEERSPTIAAQEEYALDEHLNRFVKDAIIHFFNTILSRLVKLSNINSYYAEINNIFTSKDTKIPKEEVTKFSDAIEKFKQDLDVSESDWPLKLLDEMHGNSQARLTPEENFLLLAVATHIYHEKIDAKIPHAQLTKHMSEISTFLLEIRLGGMNIHRRKSDNYEKKFKKIFSSLMETLDKYQVKNFYLLLDNTELLQKYSV